MNDQLIDNIVDTAAQLVRLCAELDRHLKQLDADHGYHGAAFHLVTRRALQGTVAEELEGRMRRAETRARALAKLTPEELKALQPFS